MDPPGPGTAENYDRPLAMCNKISSLLRVCFVEYSRAQNIPLTEYSWDSADILGRVFCWQNFLQRKDCFLVASISSSKSEPIRHGSVYDIINQPKEPTKVGHPKGEEGGGILPSIGVPVLA